MNIFAIHSNPIISGSSLVDKHIVKMPLETAQMLCSTHTLVDSGIKAPYLPSHLKHPCNLWLTESQENYEWLIYHGISLCLEYTERYSKVHSCLKLFYGRKKTDLNCPKNQLPLLLLRCPMFTKFRRIPLSVIESIIQRGKNTYILGKTIVNPILYAINKRTNCNR